MLHRKSKSTYVDSGQRDASRSGKLKRKQSINKRMIQHTTVPKKQCSFFMTSHKQPGLLELENGQQTPTLAVIEEPLSVPNATDIEEEKSNRPNETPIVSHWQEEDLLKEEHQTLRTKVPLHVSEAPLAAFLSTEQSQHQTQTVADDSQKLEQMSFVEEGAGNESSK